MSGNQAVWAARGVLFSGANEEEKMERNLGKARVKNWNRGRNWGILWLSATMVFLSLPAGAWAQKNQKDKPINPKATMPPINFPIPDVIDKDISEMLGAFQLGDIEKMHQYYAENATFVSGAYAPPVVGWPNYAAAFQADRASFQGMQIVRRNTSIFHSGDVAWACYQWELSALYAGKPYYARGQTTLIFVKAGDNWLIVHNHTSQICPNEGQRTQPATPKPSNSPAPKP